MLQGAGEEPGAAGESRRGAGGGNDALGSPIPRQETLLGFWLLAGPGLEGERNPGFLQDAVPRLPGGAGSGWESRESHKIE